MQSVATHKPQALHITLLTSLERGTLTGSCLDALRTAHHCSTAQHSSGSSTSVRTTPVPWTTPLPWAQPSCKRA